MQDIKNSSQEEIDAAIIAATAGFMAKGYEWDSLHRYSHLDGSLNYYRARFININTSKKEIRPLRWNGSSFEMKEPDFANKKPLYNLHSLKNADTVYWVEGEKCADALNELGLCATTSGGATSHDKADFEPLRGKNISIWPDNDKAGIDHANAVAASLISIGCTVDRLDLSAIGLPDKGDVIDWLAIHPQATKDDINGLQWDRDLEKSKSKSFQETNRGNATLTRATDVIVRPITWLWDQWLAKGKLTILGGAGGTGKTTLALGLATAITTGSRFPDGSLCKQIGNVLVWSSEDDPDDVLVPRLMAMGADLSRVYFVSGLTEGDQKRAFDPSTDIETLGTQVEQIGGVSLLLVDPIVSAVANDMNKANDVRRSLQPIVDFANQYQCAIIGISHLGKGTQGKDPTERILGSQAFSALARMVWLTVTNKETGDRVLVRSKSNISKTDGGFGYAVEQVEIVGGIATSRVVWKDPVDGNASEILNEYESIDDGDEKSELKDAERYLLELLESENVPAKKVQSDSKNAGFTWATIRRASKSIGVKKIKSGMDGGWYWSFPRATQNHEDAQIFPKMLTQKNEHLRDKLSTFEEKDSILEADITPQTIPFWRKS